MSRAAGGEIRALTGLRMVAASWVVLLHFSVELGDTYGPALGPLWWIIGSGWLGVDLFFVLSGFVITHTYLNKMGPRPGAWKTVDFLWARFCRIWPAWALITLLFSGFLVLMHHIDPQADGGDPKVLVSRVLEQIGMVQMWGGRPLTEASYVLPGWSVSVEWLAYLIFPVIVLVLWRLRRLPPVVSGALSVLALLPLAWLSLRTGMANMDYPWLLRIGGGFVGGAMACLMVRRVRQSGRVARLAPLVTVVSVVELMGVILWAHWRAGGGPGDYSGVGVVFLPPLVAALALSDKGFARWLGTDLMVAGGRISYGLYIVHWAMLSGVDWVLLVTHHAPRGGSLMRPLLFFQVLLLTVPAAWALHRYVEEPARIWLRRRGPSAWLAPRRSGVVPAAPAGKFLAPVSARGMSTEAEDTVVLRPRVAADADRFAASLSAGRPVAR